MQSLPIRAYLDQTIVPILLDGTEEKFVMFVVGGVSIVFRLFYVCTRFWLQLSICF